MSPSSCDSVSVICWDLDTTGRRLMDEICQIGGATSSTTFSQYVMPHKNPNPGARRSFGIRVVNIGRYRMLKDLESGKILKTKSEVAAIHSFLEFIKEVRNKEGSSEVILVYHEVNRKVLIPLLIQALNKSPELMESFKKIVSGFVNSVDVVQEFGDKTKITSNSLRSLCKTICNDTNPKTNSASNRSQVLYKILEGISESRNQDLASMVKKCSVSVDQEESDLVQLKNILGTQGTLRPIFEGQLRQKRLVRERAMDLRKRVASSGLNYDDLKNIYAQNQSNLDDISVILKKKIQMDSTEMMDELISLLNTHFLDSGENNDEPSALALDEIEA